MLLRLVPALTLLLLIGPVAAGLVGTALPAFGYLPILGQTDFNLDSWRNLLAAPGLMISLKLSWITGFATTLISLSIVVLFCAAWYGTRLFARMQRLLSPLLAIPHVTVAFGLAFLLAPSGWIMRLLSPWATGFSRPPDVTLIQDSYGAALIAGLVIKETPFLLLMTLAALGQADAARTSMLARSMGYGPIAAWLKTVFPRIYPQLRLPIFAVLAYSVSVVDVALVLAPSTPAPLGVRLVAWFNDPDLSLRFMASSGAILQLLLAIAAILIWCGLELIGRYLGRWWLRSGHRGVDDRVFRLIAAVPLLICFAAALTGLSSMVLWSIADHWRYPAALPAGFSWAVWLRHAPELIRVAWHTVSIGAVAALLALILVMGCLENEVRYGRHPSNRTLWLLYLPLLAPQIAFLFGAQMLLITMDLDGSWLALLWSHLVFVLPYVFLSLSDPYRAWDERYSRTARCLGASSVRVFWRIKLPILLRPVLVALAVGFAVSVGQYLPTLFAGGGRFATLTTEAVALSAGGDRRIIGVYALMQMVMPFIAFTLALALPTWLFRQRRALQIAQ